MPKVSVIVPVYKAELYVERCIKSIQNQSLKDWELILVDDCSPDKSYDIITSYAEKDERIIIKKQNSNHGPMIARRIGDMLSTGDYITYCDADDVLPENALNVLYEAAISSEADVILGNTTYIKYDGTQSNIISVLNEGDDSESLFKALLRHKIPQGLCGKMFKSALVKRNDYKEIDHMTNAEDGYILYQMIPYITKVIQVPDIVYLYMQSPNSSSQRHYSDNALENIVMMNSLRVSFISKYPHLKKEIIRQVSDILNSLIIEGYDKDGLLSQLMKKHNVFKFSSDKTILETHCLLDSMKLLYRKHMPFLFKH